jgi:hypothetical protein
VTDTGSRRLLPRQVVVGRWQRRAPRWLPKSARATAGGERERAIVRTTATGCSRLGERGRAAMRAGLGESSLKRACAATVCNTNENVSPSAVFAHRAGFVPRLGGAAQSAGSRAAGSIRRSARIPPKDAALRLRFVGSLGLSRFAPRIAPATSGRSYWRRRTALFRCSDGIGHACRFGRPEAIDDFPSRSGRCRAATVRWRRIDPERNGAMWQA